MRVCAIDVGSNSVRLLVADEGPGDALRAVERALEITRLGEGMGRGGRILPGAAERTAAAAAAFVERGRRLGADRFVLFGTWALREAENARLFLDLARERTGLDIRVLSAGEEASLAYRGATRGLSPAGEPATVVDIGGGSAEFIAGEGGGPNAWASLPIGCVRMTERFLADDPPPPGARAALRRFVMEELSRAAVPAVPAGGMLIGAGGTITTAGALALGLARYDPERIHGFRIGAGRVGDLIERLSRIPLEERRGLPGLEPKRADVIVAGLVTLRAVMDHLGAAEMTVSDEGILHGAAAEALGE
ncbi:MAG: Ppx/GppA phosphatase family protein [bacterium]|nr:Ppx/GppA phosphatase family protein [bacterium]